MIIPKCRICGCTEERACPIGCSWVTEANENIYGPICSVCALFAMSMLVYLEQANRPTQASMRRLFTEAEELRNSA